MAKETVIPKIGRMTANQVSMAMEQIMFRLHALERVSILLQCEILEDARDVDAMHTLTQSVLQTTGYIAEQVARGVDKSIGFRGEDPMEWFMPPTYFENERQGGAA